ncbi:alkaline phosphatase family protein [Clostridiaceae bacterium 35-E11]
MNKVILILLDALNYETAKNRMGFMNHLVETKHAQFYRVKGCLPSLSRPMYETILTGTNPIEHGIFNNFINRRSKEESIFHLATNKGLKTGAAAYYWISELYNESPFDIIDHRIQNDVSKNIQHGIFYYEDEYPDSHTFSDGEYIRRTYDPDFLLIHPMNIDLAGHKTSCDAPAYMEAVYKVDIILSNYIPQWIKQGYHIIVTADHGMNEIGTHGATGDTERMVPLFTIGEKFQDCNVETVDQRIIAPTICRLLDIKWSKKMIDKKFKGLR